MKIALRTKVKLDFVTGDCKKSSYQGPLLEQWIKVDNMVISWILNSMIADLSESFLYVDSSQELWAELSKRFGQSNGPMLFQLEKEISDLHQGNHSIAVYFTKLKLLWDELNAMTNVPDCICPETCPHSKQIADLKQRRRLLQFLMRLNDDYDSIRGQILLMEPLPSVNKPYSLILRAESQKLVSGNLHSAGEVAAYATKQPAHDDTEASNALVAKNFSKEKKDNKKLKNNKFYSYCQKPGHERDQCFKLHGYPEWFEKKRNARLAANVQQHSDTSYSDTPLDVSHMTNSGGFRVISSETNSQFDTRFIQAIAQEVMKMTKGKQSFDYQGDTANQYAHFAGPFK